MNQQVYDAVNRALPFLMLACGFMAGWSFRDWMKIRDDQIKGENERLKAESDARIERENAEHAERMRRDREEYEAAKAKAAEQELLRETEEKQADAYVARFQSVAWEDEEICMFAIAIHERGGSVILHEDVADALEDIDSDYHPLLNMKPVGGKKEKVSVKDWVAIALNRDKSLTDDYGVSDDLDKIRAVLTRHIEDAARM